MKSKPRIGCELNEYEVDALEKSIQRSGLENKTRYLKLALELLQWAIREREKGRIIASMKDIDADTSDIQPIELLGILPWKSR